jgi:hypothetical protein
LTIAAGVGDLDADREGVAALATVVLRLARVPDLLVGSCSCVSEPSKPATKCADALAAGSVSHDIDPVPGRSPAVSWTMMPVGVSAAPPFGVCR